MNSFKEIASRFNLPYDSRSQDWELEVADPSRISEFLSGFPELDEPELKRVLTEILMASFDEAAELNQLNLQEWQRFWSFLRDDLDSYSDIIAYWVRKPEGGFWSISSQLKDSLTQDGLWHLVS